MLERDWSDIGFLSAAVYKTNLQTTSPLLIAQRRMFHVRGSTAEISDLMTVLRLAQIEGSGKKSMESAGFDEG